MPWAVPLSSHFQQHDGNKARPFTLAHLASPPLGNQARQLGPESSQALK